MKKNDVLREWQRNRGALEMNDFEVCIQQNCEASRYKLKGRVKYKAERDSLQMQKSSRT